MNPTLAPLARRDGFWMLGIFATALAVRLLYLDQIWNIPFIDFPVVDAHAYHSWAKRIADGAWLGDRVFYQAPAYPYFLALIYRVAGPDLHVALAVQMLLGATSCVLMFLATRAFFDRATAVAAGFLLSLYAPAIFFEGLIQKAGFGLFLTALLLYAVSQFRVRLGFGRALLCGVGVGLLGLTRENALVFAPLLALWMLFGYRTHRPRERVRWVAGLGVGVALILIPVGIRNYAVGDTFALTTSQLGPNFYIGNNPRATGLYVPLIPGRQTPIFEGRDAQKLAERSLGRALSRGEVSRYWLGRGLGFVREQPQKWLDLLVYKGVLALNRFEIPDAEDIYIYGEWSSLLGRLHRVMHFGVLLPLGILGMGIAWREGRPRRVLQGAVVVFFASVALFYVFARYRFPLVPLLVPFAALGLVASVSLLRRKQFRTLLIPLPVALLFAGIANVEILDEAKMRATGHINLGNIMLRTGDLEAAEKYLERAESVIPKDPDLQLHLGVLRLRQDRTPEAEGHLKTMLELKESDYRGHVLLARILRERGRLKAANYHRRRALALNPNAMRWRASAPPLTAEPSEIPTSPDSDAGRTE